MLSSRASAHGGSRVKFPGTDQSACVPCICVQDYIYQAEKAAAAQEQYYQQQQQAAKKGGRGRK